MKTASIALGLAIVAFAIALVSLPIPLGAAVFGAFGAIVCLPLVIVLALCVAARGALLRLMNGDGEGG